MGIFVAEDEKLTKQRKAAQEAENKKKGIEEEVQWFIRSGARRVENAPTPHTGNITCGALRSRALRIARTVLAARDELPTFLASHDLHEQIAAEPNSGPLHVRMY